MALSDRRPPGEDRHGERGFVLAIVLVFLVVLGISAVAASRVTRTNTQVIHNIRNEKIAFYAGEAGVTEAVLRLEMTGPKLVTVDGLTFDARIAPKTVDPNWRALVLSGSFDPGLTGSLFQAPSIQPAGNALPYLTAADGAEALQVSWLLESGTIKRINGKPVLLVESTGRFGNARRKIVVQLRYNGPLSTLVLDPLACPGIDSRGTGGLSFPGGLHVNSTCSQGIAVNGSGAVTSNGDISVTGNYTGNVSPTPATGAPILPDPLATLPPPSFLGQPVRSGTALSPSTQRISDTRTISPGIYYGGLQIKAGGNVTMQPGVYIMAGGGFEVSSSATVTGSELMIYNTLDPTKPTGAGAFGPFSITANLPITLRSPTSGTYAGILFFQDRLNTRPMELGGGATGTLDGVIYLAGAQLQMSGNSQILDAQLIVASIHANGTPIIGMPTNPIQMGEPAVTRIAWQDW